MKKKQHQEEKKTVQTSFDYQAATAGIAKRGVNNQKIIKQKRALKIPAMLLTYL